MPAILVGVSQRNEQMWQALKTYIMRDRQRKKQEQEAEEEERLHKKRKHQQKQDVMTLGETAEQIANLQNEVLELRAEKRQLDTKLRRVIYEKENRKQQLIKENSINSEMLMVEGYSAMNTEVEYPQLLSPTTQGASPPYELNIDKSHIFTTGFSKETFSSPSTLSTSPMPLTSSIPCDISHYKPLPHISSYNSPSSSKSKEAVGLPSNSQESIIYKDSLLRWIMRNSLSLNKRNYGYPLIMPQSSRETSELSESTYSTEHRTHRSAYVTNMHAMEQCKDSYNEEKHYLQSNQNIIHATTMQQLSQDTKISEITTGFSRLSTVIPYQPPQPHIPAVSEDMSHITLRRLLYDQPYKTPMSYNKYSLYHKTDL